MIWSERPKNKLKESEDATSDDWENYEWSLIASDIENTEWLYYWIKFSTSDLDPGLCPSSNAVFNFSDSAINSTYMGIAYDKKISAES